MPRYPATIRFPLEPHDGVHVTLLVPGVVYSDGREGIPAKEARRIERIMRGEEDYRGYPHEWTLVASTGSDVALTASNALP